MAVLERKVNEAAMPESALHVCLKELKRYVWPEHCLSLTGVREVYKLSTPDRLMTLSQKKLINK